MPSISLCQRPLRLNRKVRLQHGDMIAAGQVRKELAALQELVSGAVELIALARSGMAQTSQISRRFINEPIHCDGPAERTALSNGM